MNQKKARSPAKRIRYGFLAFCCLVLLVACGNNMRDNSRLKPYEASPIFPDGTPIFADGTSARPIDPNAVARSQSVDLVLISGKQDGAVVSAFPITVDSGTVTRGQNAYTIYCVPCHGAAADGRGIVSGYFNPKPANLITDTQRLQPVGHFFDVITNGKGVMYPYASRITPADRWALIAYIRALQINKEKPLEVPADQIQASGGGVK
jgi:mono/diheme cytochrome c family protein